MTKKEQKAVIMQGAEAWNAWREKNKDAVIDLKGANLEKIDLKGANLSHARLEGVNFSFARLDNADFKHANLKGANLSHAHLRRACFAFSHLERAVLLFANMQGADFRGADLRHASFEDANLESADLSHTHLENAMLAYANLKKADLVNANLEGASLKASNLEGANVSSVLYDQNILPAVFRETRLKPKALWKRRFDIMLDTTMRCRGIYSACYGSQRFLTFVRDQAYLEEFLETKRGTIVCFFWWLFSNCGRSIARWAIWSLVFILLFSFVFALMGAQHFYTPMLRFDLLTMVYYSVVTFTTLGGDIFPTTHMAAVLTMLEVLLGYVMLGGLISIFACKLARRGD